MERWLRYSLPMSLRYTDAALRVLRRIRQQGAHIVALGSEQQVIERQLGHFLARTPRSGGEYEFTPEGVAEAQRYADEPIPLRPVEKSLLYDAALGTRSFFASNYVAVHHLVEAGLITADLGARTYELTSAGEEEARRLVQQG
ncbi:hypothetical protein CcrColossus_gp439 [Caulobacter phage CcrColossus]|uniref:Uncharacterized protein n=1 Tax=Caulobacter phage CcrColossus TaxID=1211640 RepID=K4JSI5_9CAUD|nr:hypothetical protein CcrColossus_gp439 [Caulobacter phage CcrColossus]AFU88309.1 hypothetical protein CcrColossus_gp439 [Caulobacter phage CcrColossus]